MKTEMDTNTIQQNNKIPYNDEKKVFDEHQQLYLDLSMSNLEKKSIIFYPSDRTGYIGEYESYFNDIIYDDKQFSIYNILYLPGIKITNGEIYTELELGRTISQDIMKECLICDEYGKNGEKCYIFCHFNIEQDPNKDYNTDTNTNDELQLINNYGYFDDSIIPDEIMESIKKIEKSEVEIIKEKNKILNSTYVKTKLNFPLKNFDQYIKFSKFFLDLKKGLI